MKFRLAWLVAVTALTLSALTGCGPTAAEIHAMEQAKIQAEQARLARLAAIKAENDARLKRIEDAERSGDTAAKTGKNQEAIDFYVRALKEIPPDSSEDFRVRKKSNRLGQSTADRTCRTG